jgi:D-alanyl-D-alanine carboxypeptidase/D-alanyl-D-alanine-endopeptidase (penicillin-binding protein 4)
MLRDSDNFYAETLLKDIGASGHGEDAGASTADGRRVARSELEELGIDLGAVTWLDGSGLSYGNRVTARTLGHVLGVGSQAAWGPQWIDAFARSGTYGTLRHRMTRMPYRGRVAAKTGTLDHASGLAGFAARLGSDHRYGFVVLSSASSGRSISYSAARNLQDHIAMVLVR